MCNLVRRTALFALLLLVGTAAWADSSTSPERDVPLGRELGRQAESMYGLTRVPEYTQRVERVGKMLVEGLKPEHRPYRYDFKVLRKADFNAFALPGGAIYLHEGLLNRLQGDGPLAFILAHEMAHSNKRHWADKVKRAEVIGIIGAILGGVAPGADILVGLVGKISNASYSRDKEREADAEAVRYMAEAGLDLNGAVLAMDELIELTNNTKSGYLSSHPAPADRKKLILEYLSRQQDQPATPLATAAAVEPPPLEMALPCPPLPNLHYPLTVGSTWRYLIEADGTRTSIAVEVLEAMPVREGVIYRLQNRGLGKAGKPYEVAVGEAGVWRRPSVGSGAGQWKLEYLLPRQDCATADCGDLFRCLGNESLTTPAGTFTDALHLARQDAQGQGLCELWFAPGVGLVKRVHANGVQEILQEYKIEAERTQ